MKVRELIKILADLPMDYNVDISVKVGEHYHFAKEFAISQFEGNRIGLYGIEEESKREIIITRELLDSFEYTAYGWVDDGYEGKLADAIVRAMGINGCCTMWKKGTRHDYFVAWCLDESGDEYWETFDYEKISRMLKCKTIKL